MQEVDLTKDIDKLEYYQADSLIDELLAVEKHLLDIYEGKALAFCIECLANKHFRLIRKLSEECIGGKCRSEELWKDINKWVGNLLTTKEYETLKKGDERAKVWAQEARDFRKKLVEEIVAETRIAFETEYKGEHLIP